MLRFMSALSVIAMLSVLGCSRPIPAQDLVGTWQATSDSIAKLPKAPEKCVLQLCADGSCVVENVPDLAYEGDIKGAFLSGKGNWHFEEEYGWQIVQCKIEQGYELDLRVRRTRGGLRVFFFIGDPDSWNLFEYEKKE